MKKKQKTVNLNNGIVLLAIIIVVGLTAYNVVRSTVALQKEEQTYIMREEALNKRIQEEKDRTASLNKQKEYVTTRDYIEEVAKEKLGLLNPDEVLLKEKE